MNVEIIRKLLDSGNIDDAKIGLLFLKEIPSEEVRDKFINGAESNNSYIISHAKFSHLDFLGIYYKLTNNLYANVYSHGIILVEEESKYEEL